jgi:two-component system sensor histidine kinase QseC
MRSLRNRISVLVLAVIAAVLIPLVTLSYVFMRGEVDELSDARLAQSARTISALVADAGTTALTAKVPLEISSWHDEEGKQALTVRGHSYEMEIGFQYWSVAKRLLMNSGNLRDIPLVAAAAGFADILVSGRRWRVFTLQDARRNWVRVGERYDSRHDIARALAIEAVAPVAIGLPLLALLAGWAVRRGLRPLRVLADRLAERRPDDTEAVAVADLPREIEPVVAALNGLLSRVRSLLHHERQFTANAAHELRTPLAGALIHIENAQAAATPTAIAQALGKAEQGLTRLTRIVNQMLELARWDAATSTRELQAVDLRRCVDEELQELGAMAADKDLEIAINSEAEACIVDGWEPGLRTLLRNLLDNAIRYSFPGGRVEIDIAQHDGGTRLSIANHGPGIEPARRASMFERFQRGPDGISEGSGLGLSIVARVAQLHRARVTLADVDTHEGLRVEITFPAPIIATRPTTSSAGVGYSP